MNAVVIIVLFGLMQALRAFGGPAAAATSSRARTSFETFLIALSLRRGPALTYARLLVAAGV